MNQADQIVLKTLQPHMSDLGYAMVAHEVAKAGGIQKLTNSVAIAELMKAKERFTEVSKLKNFGGNRSAAASYAAHARWGQSSGDSPKTRPEGSTLRSVNVDGQSRPVQFHVVHKPANEVKMGDLTVIGDGKSDDVRVIAREIVPSSGTGGPRQLLATPAQFEQGKGGVSLKPLSYANATPVKVAADGTIPVLTIRFPARKAEDDVEKGKSFGGDRSAAGAYAASVRWSKNKKPEGDSSASGGAAAAEVEKPRYSSAFNDEGLLDETETSINRAYDKSGFGEEKGDALAAVDGTRKTLYEAKRSLEIGVPIETVRGGLVKEQKRLKSLSTRTRKKGEDLQVAEGGPKKDANGKWVMTRSARFFTDAQVIKNMASMLELTIRRLDALRP